MTLPPGSIAEVLARAHGCYEAVYALNGEQWLRYAPDVPGYARNLVSTNGTAVWIMASEEDCGPIDL